MLLLPPLQKVVVPLMVAVGVVSTLTTTLSVTEPQPLVALNTEVPDMLVVAEVRVGF